jgi:Rrf2 family protein
MIRISKKTEYALRALVEFSFQSNTQSLLSIQKIAQSTEIPVKFLEQILLVLKNAGILKSKRGMVGGYSLQRSLNEITLEEILKAIDGPLCEWPCIENQNPEGCSCADTETCPIRLSFEPVYQQLHQALRETTLLQLTDKIQSLKSKKQGTPQYMI